ncbi:MAG TPA: hypothetical protein VFT39_07730 [Vicinamibacterales bacterium]|nr:hypothetical protein [Vicinamibacterales bacterium]
MPYRSAVAFLLVITAAPPAAAQVSVVMHSGIKVEMTARIEPGSVRIPSGVMAIHIGRFHRVVQDRSQRRYFAYDVLVEPKIDSRAFQVRIEPFSLSATDLDRMEVDPSWTYVPLLKYPLVPDVRAGDSVAIDLLENPTTGQKVVDYFVFKRADATAGAELSPVRDLSLADVQLRLDDLRISVNGSVLDASTRVGGSISGAALWFYLPQRGRFVMSLVPNPKLGFRRAGEVTNALLSFTDGSDRYDIKSTAPIAPASGRFNLYVLRDSKWRPSGSEVDAPLLVGAADRPESLTAK